MLSNYAVFLLSVIFLYFTEEAMTFLVEKVIHFKTQEANNDAIILQETSDRNSKNKVPCCG
jgi:hypothetical protein